MISWRSLHWCKTELNAPKLRKLTRDDWVKFAELYDVYHHSDGRDSMVELIAPTSLGYAAFLCKMNKETLLTTSDEEFSEIMNKKFAVDNATGHKKILQSFAMSKCTIQGFSRQNVESYINDYMTKITCYPALVDSTKKGASATQANKWFIDGLQPEEFRQAVLAHDTKTVDETCEIIGDDITEFEGVLRVLGLTQIKGMIKAAPVPVHTPAKGSSSDGQVRKFKYPCGNCGGDHDKRTCQHRDECLPCKTKLHAFWSPQCP